MLHSVARWLDEQPAGRRRLYSLLLAVILLTLPFYAAGLALLLAAPPDPGISGLPTAVAGPATVVPTAAFLAAPTIQQRAPVLRGQPLATHTQPPPPPTAALDASPTFEVPGVPEFVVVTVPPLLTATMVFQPTQTEPSPPPPPEPSATEAAPPEPSQAVPTEEPSAPPDVTTEPSTPATTSESPP
jgi:hypothetical protein